MNRKQPPNHQAQALLHKHAVTEEHQRKPPQQNRKTAHEPIKASET